MAKSTTFKGEPKPFGASGHFNEPKRHEMQAKGYKTGHLANKVHPLDYTGAKPKPKGRLVSVRVYKFDELPKEIQEKVLDEHRQINVDFDWWDMDGLVDFNEQDFKDAGVQPLPKEWYNRKLMPDKIHYEGVEYPAYIGLIKYSHKNMYFDIDRGQYLQLNDIEVKDDNVFRKFLKIPEKLWGKVSYRFDSSGRETNTTLEFRDNEGDDFEDSEKLSPAERDTLKNAQDKWQDKMGEALKMLKDTYESSMEDEEVADTIRANEYDFKENGEQF